MGECHLTPKGMAEVMLERAGIDSFMEQKLAEIGFFTQPASKGHHLAKVGGLVRHSINVTLRLEQLTATLGVEWSRKESPYIVGMLHDLVKCRCYRAVAGAQGAEPEWEYVQPTYPGHGTCSVAIAAELGIRLNPDEIAAIIYHMGAFSFGKEYSDKEFNAAMDKFAPQIIATHSADMYASAVDEAKSTAQEELKSKAEVESCKQEKHAEEQTKGFLQCCQINRNRACSPSCPLYEAKMLGVRCSHVLEQQKSGTEKESEAKK